MESTIHPGYLDAQLLQNAQLDHQLRDLPEKLWIECQVRGFRFLMSDVQISTKSFTSTVQEDIHTACCLIELNAKKIIASPTVQTSTAWGLFVKELHIISQQLEKHPDASFIESINTPASMGIILISAAIWTNIFVNMVRKS